jgi:hypothetical protein
VGHDPDLECVDNREILDVFGVLGKEVGESVENAEGKSALSVESSTKLPPR